MKPGEQEVLVFLRQELLEWSVVQVGADPGAIVGRSDGTTFTPEKLQVRLGIYHCVFLIFVREVREGHIILSVLLDMNVSLIEAFGRVRLHFCGSLPQSAKVQGSSCQALQRSSLIAWKDLNVRSLDWPVKAFFCLSVKIICHHLLGCPNQSQLP